MGGEGNKKACSKCALFHRFKTKNRDGKRGPSKKNTEHLLEEEIGVDASISPFDLFIFSSLIIFNGKILRTNLNEISLCIMDG